MGGVKGANGGGGRAIAGARHGAIELVLAEDEGQDGHRDEGRDVGGVCQSGERDQAPPSPVPGFAAPK